MVWTIPASAWTWLVRLRKASAVIMNSAWFDAGEGNPGSVIILQKRLGVGTAAVASSVGRGCGCCRSSVHGNPIALVAYPVVVRLSSLRSTVQPLGIRPYLCQVGRTTARDSALPVPSRPHDHWRPHTYVRPAYRVGSPISTDQLSEGAMM
ncbi:hypothetical protein BHM03_00051059 [Ensete ventricosum]|nr:hypothetical protein BHM03_00051059 [Ensete ventricosum]